MKHKRLVSILVPLLVLVTAALACGPTPAVKPTVSILAPPNGTQVAVGQAVEVEFHAEDGKAVLWVQMAVGSDVVATMQSPIASGQTPLDGILRWVPASPGAFTLTVSAHNADGQDSDPAAVSITVVQAEAGAPTPTLVSTPAQEDKAPTEAADQPTATATTEPDQPALTATPTPTTKPAQRASTATATTKPAAADVPTATPTTTSTPTTKPAQPVPTATSTQPPPTATSPPPTNTPLPPTIDYFTLAPSTITSGDCTTLSWGTSNASGGVTLDGSPADASGTMGVCPVVVADTTITYRLVANGTPGTTPAVQERTLTVQLPPQEVMLDAAYVPDFSGNVSEDGVIDTAAVNPRDDDANKGWTAFVTFSFLDIPGDAQIVSALLEMGSCSTAGDPFKNLGPLRVYDYYYGDLDAADYLDSYNGVQLGEVRECTGWGSGSIDVTASVQAHVAQAYYQIALYFPIYSNGDDVEDGIMFSDPTLTVVYTQ
jgi:hypothetical protein